MKHRLASPALLFFCLTIISTLFSQQINAKDWNTYLADRERAGATTDSISLPLAPAWKYVAPSPPKTGQTDPGERVMEGKDLEARVDFDDALHVAIADGRAYFGSSVDHLMRCVDLKSGKLLWSYFTGGPIRLSPTINQSHVYFGSDDGFVYCLDAKTGKEVWKLRAGLNEEMIIARGEMVSRWPVRTNVLIDDGIAYFGAGIFPHENIYLYAVDAKTGKVIWKIDNLSQTSAGRNELSPQGYILANDEFLFFPSGRSLPAAFNKKTGEEEHKRSYSWRSTAGGVVGGTQALLADGQIYSMGAHHILALTQSKGDVGFAWITGQQMAVQGESAYLATGSSIRKVNRGEHAVGSQKAHKNDMTINGLLRKLRSLKGKKAEEARAEIKALQEENKTFVKAGVLWEIAAPARDSLIVAGDKVIVGGEDQVLILDEATGKLLETLKVKGHARGLAVSDGQLVVSTSAGEIIGYGSSKSDQPATQINPLTAASPYPADEMTPVYQQAAKDILAHTNIKDGFCLVLGSEEGRLAYELARNSNLKIYCIEPDPAKVEQARQKLAQAGYYGHRVAVHQTELSPLPYSRYFANLIVSDTLLKTGQIPGIPKDIATHVKPLGGTICLGIPANSQAEKTSNTQLIDWLKQTGLSETSKINDLQGYATLVRGALPGAGSWSHQYGDPGNTASSKDQLVRGGLGVLWFGDPGEKKMVNRHEGAVGPLAINGRLFIQGESTIMAFDAYNGLFLWERENPQAIRTGVFQNQNPGNLVASDDSLFFMMKESCYQLDAATGKTVAKIPLPEKLNDGKHEWGYLAYQNGMIFGTATTRKELEARQVRRGRRTEDSTDALFAIDVKTGKPAWSYQGKNIAHHTIAIGPEAAYFIDSSITSEQRAEILRQDKSHLEKLTGKEREIAEDRLKIQDLRLAVALDIKTGKKLWSKPVDVTDCSEIGIGGGKLTLLYQNNVLLLCGANANGHYWKQFIAGDFSRRRLVALNAGDGALLWKKDANYRHRPIVVGDKIIAEPWSYDLYTGVQHTRKHPLTGQEVPWSIMREGHHCGMLSASENLLMFRSGYTGFYDLEKDAGTRHFAGHRTGCWINAIPANGLVMIPESSAGCVCLFSISSTIVLEPREERTHWTIFSSVGPKTPVQHMALNMGAPGDRRDAHGTVWMAYPRPKPSRETGLDFKFDIQPKFSEGGGYDSLNEITHPVKNAEPGWVYTSWAKGLKECTIPLLGKSDAPANYTVELSFSGLEPVSLTNQQEPPLYEIKLQGQVVQKDFNPQTAKSTQTLKFKGVPVKENLQLELVPQNDSARQTPAALSGIEIIRSDS
ncbi:outer membrane protein assembly factor BamB family protein [Gimesia algae]|uniref:Alcohol dehydrogenase [cytochrome c] n=1 Tax=Gimesia algae TaxID=2527971 RepID=A0A517VG27_9PLAN|nr:PQQ-binding-like beta-propeller repeat protein [Gimesia algae]QDT91976.1 Alcohol dehydrogenase [cytochrome c] precursor [Gimesia algae]